MKKQYIRMNNNDEYLSLGNLFRIIKDSSKNKTSALQSEIFCILFEVESINDTTVNNYCVGCRGIGGEYKQVFLNKKKRYSKNKEEFANNIIELLSIIDGVIYNINKGQIEFINEQETALVLAKKLYNLAKNDKYVIKEFTNNLYHLIDSKQIYECLVEELCFIVLEHKQPLFEDELKKEVFENVLNDTSISSIDLQEYLSLKLREGINFDYSMKKLAEAGNAYANFEIGSNEYYGYYTGHERYDVAYKYLKVAADLNHASANYMIANMLIRGLLGNKSKDELERGYEYLIKSYNLGNIAASNLIGNMYYNGIHPLEKNIEEAMKYYKIAAENDYAFALNNLGKIEENKNNMEGAFKYYRKAADLGESWACNKVGEFYRLGILEKDMKEAFYYYNRAIESNYRTLCYYAYYNLAVYYYKNGYDEIPVSHDENKYVEYLNMARANGILEAMVELLKYYVVRYKYKGDNHCYNELIELKEIIEKHPKFNDEMKDKIEKILKEGAKKDINIDVFQKFIDSV